MPKIQPGQSGSLPQPQPQPVGPQPKSDPKPRRSLLDSTTTTSLGTTKNSVIRSSVDTLIIPISFEGCTRPASSGGGTYSAPWYSKTVRQAGRLAGSDKEPVGCVCACL